MSQERLDEIKEWAQACIDGATTAEPLRWWYEVLELCDAYGAAQAAAARHVYVASSIYKDDSCNECGKDPGDPLHIRFE